ncbi:TetR/AcrR family transcriptional regulator [Roseovarius sp. A21]|uniref:TetR/AcrR family transcriptional regulator n=1 Tax=Roseovarius bejariae TaxID=2576383 RepID=A0A844CHI7_9RHOB|nr:TetR/AcrR family transcriptional regulator [Roseovarius bejariae]MRU14781.1 TetR/AcrR family transcriptional regulator [Roseovarius bejariae]
MKDAKKSARMAEIQEAAYALLAEKGFGGTSMLAVAKRAKASNETLYNWYGDKLGLFRAMVEANAARVRETLEAALDHDADPVQTLQAVGPLLLTMLTSEKAVALNRAAAADASGTLGTALAQAGRQAVAPLIADVMERAKAAGQLRFEDPAEAVDLYLGLLIGDLQLRRVTGQIPAPGHAAINARSGRAFDALTRLLGDRR